MTMTFSIEEMKVMEAALVEYWNLLPESAGNSEPAKALLTKVRAAKQVAR